MIIRFKIGSLIFEGDFPKFYALPMLGGIFWATGNLATVPIIKSIGIGLGPLLWNTVLLVFGWAVARFGFFGVKEEIPSNTLLNYIGVLLTAISGLFYLFIKTESKRSEDRQPIIQNDINDDINGINVVINNEDTESEGDFLHSINPNVKRVVGIVCACISGI